MLVRSGFFFKEDKCLGKVKKGLNYFFITIPHVFLWIVPEANGCYAGRTRKEYGKANGCVCRVAISKGPLRMAVSAVMKAMMRNLIGAGQVVE